VILIQQHYRRTDGQTTCNLNTAIWTMVHRAVKSGREHAIAVLSMAGRFVHHCDQNSLLPARQSAYRRHHSTKTAVLIVHNDIVHAVDSNQLVPLVLLDLSSAFDTVDHGCLSSVILGRCQNSSLVTESVIIRLLTTNNCILPFLQTRCMWANT